jgi:hypothetical protein
MKNRLSEIIGVSLLALVVLLVYSVQGWSREKAEEIFDLSNKIFTPGRR